MLHTVTLLAAAALAGAVIYYSHWVLVRRRFVEIAPGVYQSGAMWPCWLIRCVRRHGIDAVIDLRGAREPGVLAEARALSRAGIRYINVPVGQLPTRETVACFLGLMAEAHAAGRRILFHCKDGQGRAIALAAIYRIEFRGWSALDAYRGGSRLPPGLRWVSRLHPQAGLLSRRNTKTRFILEYRPTRREHAERIEEPAALSPLGERV